MDLLISPPLQALAGVIVASLAVWASRSRLSRRTLLAGIAILVLVWLPFLIIVALEPLVGSAAIEDWVGNALGLGLLAWGGTYIGLVIVVVGLAVLMGERLAGKGT